MHHLVLFDHIVALFSTVHIILFTRAAWYIYAYTCIYLTQHKVSVCIYSHYILQSKLRTEWGRNLI